MKDQKKQKQKKLMHPIWIIIIDLVLTAAALGTYAYFYLVRSVVYQTVDYSETVSQAESNTTDETSAQDFREKFAGKFTDGEILQCDTMYISDDVNVSLICVQKNDVTYYIEDIYVADVTCLRTAFANDTYGKNITQWIPDMAEEHNAICAINGDYYGIDEDGIVIRNGVLYNDEMDPDDDVCVLFYDGTMRTYTIEEFDVDEVMAEGAYQPGVLARIDG
jgi:exopolysaccharide biosynthesis protein